MRVTGIGLEEKGFGTTARENSQRGITGPLVCRIMGLERRTF